jgi:hypothetical protein
VQVEKGYVKRDLFDEAEREVFKLIDLNDMPRLRKSESQCNAALCFASALCCVLCVCFSNS